MLVINQARFCWPIATATTSTCLINILCWSRIFFSDAKVASFFSSAKTPPASPFFTLTRYCTKKGNTVLTVNDKKHGNVLKRLFTIASERGANNPTLIGVYVVTTLLLNSEKTSMKSDITFLFLCLFFVTRKSVIKSINFCPSLFLHGNRLLLESNIFTVRFDSSVKHYSCQNWPKILLRKVQCDL